MASIRPIRAMPASAPSAKRPALKWSFHFAAHGVPIRLRHARRDRAVGDDLDVAVGDQHVDQHAVVARRVPDAEVPEHEHARARAASLPYQRSRQVEGGLDREADLAGVPALDVRDGRLDRAQHSGREAPARAPARREQVLERAADRHDLPAPRSAAAPEAAAAAAESPRPRPRRIRRRPSRRSSSRRAAARSTSAPPPPKPSASEARGRRAPTPIASAERLRDDPGEPARDAAVATEPSAAAEDRAQHRRSRRTGSTNRIGSIPPRPCGRRPSAAPAAAAARPRSRRSSARRPPRCRRRSRPRETAA